MDIARSSSKLFIVNVSSAAITFLGITFFARELGATRIGIYFLFETLLGLLSILTDFGLRGAVKKRISEGESRSAFLSSAIGLKLIPLSIVVLSIVVLSGFVNEYIGANVAGLLAVAMILREAAHLTMVVLEGELRVGETAIIKFARHVTWVLVGAIFVTQGFGTVGVIYGLLAGLSVMLIWGAYRISIPLGPPSLEHAHSLFEFGKYNFVSSVGGYFYNWIDVAIIGLLLTQGDVGVYEIAWRVTAVSVLLSQAIATTIYPQVSEWDSSEEKERIEELLFSVMTPSLLLVIPAFFGTVLFSREILGFIFGAEYTEAWLVLIILMFDKILQAVQIIIGRSLQAIDKPDKAARATIVSVVTNVVLNIVLIWEFGIVGAAVATVTASIVNDVLHFGYLRRYLSVRIPVREILECLFAAVVMSVILILITRVNEVDGVTELATVVVFGGVVYSVLVFLLPTLRPRVLDMLSRFGVVP